jgi:preprotein translocase subunit SecG
VHLVPIAVFVFLGLLFLDKALRSRAKRTWAWGRMGEGAPLSRVSYAILAITFFVVAFIVSRAPDPGAGAAIAIGLCFVSVIVMGYVDTRSQSKMNVSSKSEEPEKK